MAQHNAGSVPLTAKLMLEACACTRPTVLDTVPWLVEEMLNHLDAGDEVIDLMDESHYEAIMVGGWDATPII